MHIPFKKDHISADNGWMITPRFIDVYLAANIVVCVVFDKYVGYSFSKDIVMINPFHKSDGMSFQWLCCYIFYNSRVTRHILLFNAIVFTGNVLTQ